MTSRNRDFGRKYVSGAEKERKRKTRDEYIKTQKNAMHKFLKIENTTLENERTEEMPDSSTSLQRSYEIIENINENQSLEHNLSIGTVSLLKKLVLFALNLRTMIIYLLIYLLLIFFSFIHILLLILFLEHNKY